MSQTCLAGQLDCATPQRDSPQGWGCWTGQYMSGASCPSLQHTPCNTQCWLRLGYMPWPLSPEPLHRAAQMEKATNITGRESHGPWLPVAAPSITSGSGHTASDLPLTLCTLTSCLCTPHFGHFLSPHIWHKSAPPLVRPCLVVPRAQAGRDSCGPNSWGQGGEPWEP